MLPLCALFLLLCVASDGATGRRIDAHVGVEFKNGLHSAATRWTGDSSVHTKLSPTAIKAHWHEAAAAFEHSHPPQSANEIRERRAFEHSVRSARRRGQQSIPMDKRLAPRVQKELEQQGIRWVPPQGARLEWD
jgi:hypothetical protein